MSAGISLMYRLSGGCEAGRTCGECGFYEAVKGSVSFGKGTSVNRYICSIHPEIETAPDWKSGYMACKRFCERWQKVRTSRKKKEAYKTEEGTGQLAFNF